MKRIVLTLFFVVSLFRTYADEGMWLPMLLGKQVYNDMVKRGLKLTKEQLYSVNKASLKDAIIIFSGFGGLCTGEIVSSQGLMFTNHHCGYDVVASASSLEKNYLRDGFWSRSKQEEIPGQNLYAEFLLRIDDVTKRVQDSLGDLTGAERTAKQSAVLAALNSELSDKSKSINTRISSLFRGNQFLAFVYQRYNDVRLVAVPPESIGKFGGDTDNWEWPRHTGDFSVFRVYMSKDGQPAQYSSENIPLKPKYYLPVSIKGIKDGDYAMIYGYPGSTNRYETTYGIKQKIEIDNPTLVFLRDMRLKYMIQDMKTDPAVKLKLAGDYASIANYWKFYKGETEQLIKHHVYDLKLAQEEKFIQWAKGKPDFENIFTNLAKAYDAWRPYSKHLVYMNEGIFGSPLLAFAGSLQQVEYAIVKSGKSEDINRAVLAADAARENFIKSEYIPSDTKIVGSVLQLFHDSIDKSQLPIGFYESIKGTFGDLSDSATYRKYAQHVFKNTFILDSVKWKAFVANPDGTVLQNDPAYATSSAFLKNFQSKYLPMYQQFTVRINEAARLYLKGTMQMDTVKAKKMYPDAT
jgi:hypothetical protein